MKPSRSWFWLVSLTIILLSPGAYWILAEPDAPFTILLSNDDGYVSPGLRAVAEALAPMAHVVVAAPSTEQSGSGNGITYRKPIFFRHIELFAGVSGYAIQARPATCVRVGVESLLESKPDLVISGINRGANLGIVTFYSGTVGAARQAALLGLPAIAVSMQGDDPDDFATAASFTPRAGPPIARSAGIAPGPVAKCERACRKAAWSSRGQAEHCAGPGELRASHQSPWPGLFLVALDTTCRSG